MRHLIVLCVFVIVMLVLNMTECSFIPKTNENENNDSEEDNNQNKIQYPIIQEFHRQANYDDTGFWKKNVEWKARWMKEWHVKKILVPVWRKIWGPIEIHEWVPIPKQPPWNPYEQKIEKGV